MRKLFTPLLILAALLSSTQAWAESYGLTVAGVSVTDANASNITGSGISGKITYNASRKQLTIAAGTTINTSSDGINNRSIDGLTIRFDGDVTINTSCTNSTAAAICCLKNTILTTPGAAAAPVVKLNNTGAGAAIAVHYGSDLDVWNVRITATSINNSGVYASNGGKITLHHTQLVSTGGSGQAGIQGFTGGIGLLGSALAANQSISSGTVMQSGSAAQTATIYCAVTIGKFNVPTLNTYALSASNTGATSASGTAFYNTSTKTLTLTNVNVDGANLLTHGDMTINFVGGGTISSSGYTADLYGNTKLTSDGTVIIKTTGRTAVYGNSGAGIEISMPELQATSTASGNYHGLYTSGKLTLTKYNDSSVYKFLGEGSNVSVGQIVFNDMDIWSSHTWIKEGKVYYKDAIASSSNGFSDGTWFKSKNQFTYYPVYVAGTQANHRNCGDIRNQYITSGTVKYDNSTKTLTLDGVTMNVTADDVNAIKTTSGAGDITIQAVGDNTLTSVDDAAKLYSNTTFTSSSIAYLRFISNNSMGVSMYGSANATVDMVGFFQAKGAEYGFYGDGSTYPNAVLTLKKATSDEMGYNFTGAEGAIRNLGSLKLDNMDFWYSTYGCYFDEAGLCVKTNGGAVAKGQVVFGSIKETLPISVCGKQLNRVNGADNPIYVGSKYISSGTQSVGYVPSTKTLTLNNAKIENSIQKGIALESGFDGYIKLVGTNSITTAAEGYYSCIATMNDNVKATFQGNGSLYAKGGANCALMPFRGTMIITDNVKIDAVGGVSNGTSFGGIGSNGSGTNGETVIISGNAQVKANRISRIATLTLEDGQTIVEPFKAAFNSSTHQVEANGSLAQDVVIQKVEKYDLAVCDVDVNSYNKDDILRDGGTFKYAPNTKRLTITDADVHVDGYEYAAVTNRGVDGLNISVTGDNNFIVKGNTIFDLRKGTTFSGKGTITGESLWGLLLNGSSSGSSIRCYLDGPSFNLKVRKYGIAGALSNLIVDSGCLLIEPLSSDATIFGLDGLTLGTGMIIAEPKGGVFDSNKRGIIVNGSLYNGRTIICQKGDVNVDGTVTIADAVAVLNAMAGQEVAGDPDVNGDKEVSIADFVAVLNIMAGQ